VEYAEVLCLYTSSKVIILIELNLRKSTVFIAVFCRLNPTITGNFVGENKIIIVFKKAIIKRSIKVFSFAKQSQSETLLASN
jgi:hypothetical protein